MDYAVSDIGANYTTKEKDEMALDALEKGTPNEKYVATIYLMGRYPKETTAYLQMRANHLSAGGVKVSTNPITRSASAAVNISQLIGQAVTPQFNANGTVTLVPTVGISPTSFSAISDAKSAILAGVLGIAAGAVLGPLVAPLLGAGAAGVSGFINDALKSIGGLFSSSVVDPDPANPGRSLHDARTYSDQITKAYPSTFPNIGGLNVNAPSVFVKVPQYPTLDQDVKTQFPGHVFASWDGNGSWYTDYLTLAFDPNTGKLTGQHDVGSNPQGGIHVPGPAIELPGYYVESTYSDGTKRYDYVGETMPDQPALDAIKQKIETTAELNAEGQPKQTGPTQSSAGSTLVQTVLNTAAGVQGASAAGGGGSVTDITQKLLNKQPLNAADLAFIKANPQLLSLYQQYYGQMPQTAGVGGGMDTTTIIIIAVVALALFMFMGSKK